ncbi:hypothetical protein GCM10022198_11550 [Klugiella xanthotipulae]|uniref:Lipoprotein n=2 Tax=Klugiella xanthotipulae TaxID=244735 RepID=A0A543HZ56_9MICO|nr:hypothetical protein FB466_1811 [Klugiella xanthotipulae]
MNKNWTSALALAGILMAAPALAGCTADAAPEQAQEVSLPEGIPTDFPIATGTPIAAATLGSSGWSTTVTVQDADAQQAALDDLLADGYVPHGSDDGDGAHRIYSLNNGTNSVTLTLRSEDDTYLVDYSFAPMSR